MNTERFVSIVNVINQEAGNVANTVTSLVGTLQQAINQPNENTQRQVENTLNALNKLLSEAPSNRLSPGVRGDLASLTIASVSADNLVGSGLKEQIEETFKGGYTSVQTLDRLKQIENRLKTLVAALQQATTALSNLGVKGEDLAPGTSVVGMAVPREQVDGLLRLEKELHFFGQLTSLLTEVITGEHEDSPVYSLHSSAYGIDLTTALDVAAKFATIVGAIKFALDKLKDYRELKQKAETLGVDPDTIERLTAEGREKLDRRLEELTAEVFQDCKVDNEGRVNELKTAIRFKCNGLVNRIEKGFSFEVRTALPQNPDAAAKSAAAQVQAFTSVRFEPITTPLLTLPENGDNQHLETKTEKGTKPKASKAKRETP